MKKNAKAVNADLDLAQRTWAELSQSALDSLKEIMVRYGLSLSLGDLKLLDGRWYITHAGLLRIAHRRRCRGIIAHLQRRLSNPTNCRWIFKATVYKTSGSRGFVGYGDADPSNVSSLVHGAEMRVAETRAVNRALRKAYGIGLCSVEEIGALPHASDAARAKQNASYSANGNGASNAQPRLRDRLCLVIRQYQLDPTLVRCYAAEFCGTGVLRDASRELVESFITHLAEWAARDRDGLLCKLNSFTQSQEVNS